MSHILCRGEMTSVERQELEARLAERDQAFDEEKSRLTAAAIELGKERAVLAVS